MLKVTEAAVERLNEMLENATTDDSHGIRLLKTDAKLALQLDTPHEGDQVVAAGDRPILLIDPGLSIALDGATLDSVDTPDGDQFRLLGVADPDEGAPSDNGAHQ